MAEIVGFAESGNSLVALRTAFDRTMKDPEFLTEADKMGIEVSAMTGGDVDRLMKEIYETPADLVAEARRVISP
jgi:hypothetical protein